MSNVILAGQYINLDELWTECSDIMSCLNKDMTNITPAEDFQKMVEELFIEEAKDLVIEYIEAQR